MNTLAERKRVLILEAELHRTLIGLERVQLHQRAEELRERITANRWWLLGGAVAAGWLSTRLFGSVLRLLPAGMAAWRIVQKLRQK
jgi:hypothetical protein